MATSTTLAALIFLRYAKHNPALVPLLPLVPLPDHASLRHPFDWLQMETWRSLYKSHFLSEAYPEPSIYCWCPSGAPLSFFQSTSLFLIHSIIGLFIPFLTFIPSVHRHWNLSAQGLESLSAGFPDLSQALEECLAQSRHCITPRTVASPCNYP